MSTISIRLPESIHKKIKELAKKEGVSMNQLVNSAVSEKVSAILTAEYLEARGVQGSRARFEQILNSVPDEEPDEQDKLSPEN